MKQHVDRVDIIYIYTYVALCECENIISVFMFYGKSGSLFMIDLCK